MPPFFASLPEADWPEINRRLHLIPALWKMTEQRDIAAAFLKGGRDWKKWRPGGLALTALSVLEPAAAADPVQWLRTDGRERLAQAYNALVSAPGSLPAGPTTASISDFMQAALAAVALHQRYSATQDMQAIVADAGAALQAWTLTLVCLYDFLDEPAQLIETLLAKADIRTIGGKSALAQAVAYALICNETPDTVASLVAGYLQGQPAGLCLQFAVFFDRQGLSAAARSAALASPASDNASPKALYGAKLVPGELPEVFRVLGNRVEGALLAEYASEGSDHTAFGRLVEAAQSLSAELALHFGRRALSNGDTVSGLAAIQEAQALRPYDPQIYGTLAEAAALRGDEHIANVALGHVNATKGAWASQIAAARAEHHLGNTDRARSIIQRLVDASASGQSDEEQPDAKHLTESAELLTATGDHALALSAWQQVATVLPGHAHAYLSAAQHALAIHLPAQALDNAWHAVGLEPSNPASHKALAAALSASGDAAGALSRWSRVVELEPTPANKLELAEAAQAAANYPLALATATALINDPQAQELAATGQAQILAGRALNAQGEPEAAFIYFNKAIALAPKSIESWRAVAAHHRLTGDPQRALAALDAGRHLINADSPDAADFFADLGDLRADLHHLTEAANAYEKAVELQPKQFGFLKRLGELYGLQNNLPKAVDAISRAAQAAPNDPGVFHLLGQLLESAGRFPDALSAYRRAQSVGGTDIQLYRDLGRLAYQLQEIPVARSVLEKMLAGKQVRDPADVNSLVLLGAIYEQSREYESALTVYRQAIALDPSRSDLCVRLGLCCLELGQPETALAALKDTAERDLDNLELQKVMGNAYEAAHLWLESILAYEQAGRLAPDDHRLLASVARVARQAGESEKAAAALRKAIALAPNQVNYRAQLGDLLISMGSVDEARALLAESCASMPGDASLWMGLGHTQIILNEVVHAAASFEKAAALNPDSADILSALAEAHAQLGHFEQAHAAFARSAELSPANPVPLRRAGECMWSLGREAMAMALWRKVLVTHPSDVQTRFRLGTALSRQKDYKEAYAELARAAELAPSDYDVLLAVGQAAFAAGAAADSIPHLQRASQLRSDDPVVWQALGKAWQAQNRPDSALDALRMAVRIAPDRGMLQAALAEQLSAMGNVAEALTACESAMKISPDDLQVMETVGSVLLKTGRYRAAVDATGRVVAGAPNNAAAQFAYAQAQILDLASDVWDIGDVDTIRTRLGLVRPRIVQALERAAALGHDTQPITDWTGRARALFGECVEAIPLLESAASRPNNAEAAQSANADCLRYLSAAYRHTGNLTRARQASLAGLERTPDSVAAIIELGLVCLAQGDRTGARAAFQRAIELDIHSAPAYALLAETMIGSGERPEAITVYSQALSLEPERALWHFRLAELYEAEHDSAGALSHYQRAATLASDQHLAPRETAGYLAALARAHARDNDPEAARREFELALTLRDDVAAWWSQCARLNLELKNYARSLEQFGRACELQPKDTASFMGAARAALAMGQAAEAEENAISVLRQAPDNYDALIVMGEVFESRDDLNDALLAFTRAAENTTQPLQALRAQVRLYRKLKKYTDAQVVLKRIVDLSPEDDEAWAGLADVQAELGVPVQAIPLLARAVQIAPRKSKHYVALGHMYRLADQLDAALGQLQLAWDLDATNVAALREMAQVFEGRRQYNRAYEIYQKLMQLEPDNADNFFRAGMALKEMRDYLDALALFQQAVKLDPQNAEAQHQRAAVAAFGILKGRN